MNESITLPLTYHEASFWGLVLGLVLVSGLLYGALSLKGGERGAPVWESLSAGWLAIAVPLALVWVALFGMTIGAALIGTWKAISDPKLATLGLGGLIAALLGAPFVIWGTVLKHRALDLSNATFFHDKINDALTGLYSRRQETRSVTHEDGEKILTEWQDDILQRSAAIDRLEGLVRENPSEAPRVADMLSVYVRELSRRYPALDHPRTAWLALVEPEDDSAPMSENDALYQLRFNPDDVSVESLRNWSYGLQPFRSDIEKAAQTLGRLKRIPGADVEAIRIDLRRANMQGFDLRGLQLSNADLSFTRLEGARLDDADLTSANLLRSRLEGVRFDNAFLESAELHRANMDGASLDSARVTNASLRMASLREAFIDFAVLDGSILSEAKMTDATFYQTSLRGAQFRNAQMTLSTFRQSTLISANGLTADQLANTFGDGSVVLPDGIRSPAHWPKAALSGTDFDAELARWRDSPSTYTPPKVG